MDRNLTEKFFKNETTPDETERVLEWFNTSDGRKYLEKKLNSDFDLMDEERIQDMISDLDSEKVYKSILHKLKTKRINKKRKTHVLVPVLKVAATILVFLTVSIFVYLTHDSSRNMVAEREPIHFQTSGDQQKEITLGDGTIVRMNSNSELRISENFMFESREVKLTGEAFFDVEPDPDKPFVIHANQSVIRVLGTSFNIRSISDQENVQVAVVEGRVFFSSTADNIEEQSVVLNEGQYGYLDANEHTMTVEEYAVDNYLAWKSGRFVFEELTLTQVCTQLNRLYEIECSYAEEDFKELLLTANFSNDSLEKTLSVISLSLKIDFEIEGDRVYWTHEKRVRDQKETS